MGLRIQAEAAPAPRAQIGEIDPARLLAALTGVRAYAHQPASEVVQRYLALVVTMLATQNAMLAQVSSTSLTIIAIQGSWASQLPAGSTRPLVATFARPVRATVAPLVVEDAVQEPHEMVGALAAIGPVGAYLSVPLHLHEDYPSATLCTFAPQPRAFTPAQLDFVQVVAGQVALALAHDERAQAMWKAEQELTHDLHQTQAALDAQKTTLRRVAHDLRTPLMHVHGYAELLQVVATGTLSDEQQHMLRGISRASRFMSRLTNDLDVETYTQASYKLRVTLFDPHIPARDVIAMCQSDAQQRDLTLHFQTAEGAPNLVGDQERIQHVLLNLLSNALSYTEHGQVILEVVNDTTEIEYRVTDTGSGIAPQDQERIWEPYVRATPHGQGLGLGLTVVRRLVQAMGGTVGVMSAPGAGSVFWARLPVGGPPEFREAAGHATAPEPEEALLADRERSDYRSTHIAGAVTPMPS